VSVLFLITARGGSKGVPGKNLKKFDGLTAIEWKICAARSADRDADILCSSDSSQILDEASRLGVLKIPRPAELSTDTATSADVIKHALSIFTYSFDYIVLMEPSAPFTTGEQYSQALKMMDFHGADLVVGMKETEPNTAFIGDYREDHSVTPIIVQFQRGLRRRQDYVKQWTMNGALYVFRRDMFLRTGDIYGGNRNYGLMMNRWNSIEIDTPEDLEMAEYAVAKGYVKPCM
jgi:CMP-N,N'-diacetyllegionaminic acid synthase